MKNESKYKSASHRVLKKTRKTWEISPVERVVRSNKEYNRQEAKQELKEVIDEELDDFDWWYNDGFENEISAG